VTKRPATEHRVLFSARFRFLLPALPLSMSIHLHGADALMKKMYHTVSALQARLGQNFPLSRLHLPRAGPHLDRRSRASEANRGLTYKRTSRTSEVPNRRAFRRSISALMKISPVLKRDYIRRALFMILHATTRFSDRTIKTEISGSCWSSVFFWPATLDTHRFVRELLKIDNVDADLAL